MTDRKRTGFTLVELLVVIVIIAMLVGLLVPAVIRAREAARKAKCKNNQKEIGLAMLHYDTSTGHLPGLVNNLGPGTTWPLSWATVLLPGMGREDVWNNWKLMMTSQAPSGTQLWTGNLPQMVCPSTDVVAAGLNYVANGGSFDSTFMGSSGSNPIQTVSEVTAGVILDYGNVPTMPRMTASNIKDGAAQTLMLSENLQTGNWMGGMVGATGVTVTPNPNPWSGTVQYNLVGMFWTLASLSSANAKGLGINVGRTDQNYPQSVTDFSHARPSSNHPGVVVVTYCDGHQDELSEEIAYLVYAQLMAPDDLGAGLTPMTTPPSTP
jgi:prepilin-type N-terminal cleavage/methylation domain-containing protein